MKLQSKQKFKPMIDQLRADVLALVSAMDLTGTDLKVTQAMYIIEEAFNFAIKGEKITPGEVFLLGTAKAQAAEISGE